MCKENIMKKILITGGAGFIGSHLAFYFQKNFKNSNIVVFDCFRSESTFSNGNLKSLGHYKNLIDFNGTVICGNINNKSDIASLDNYKFDFIFKAKTKNLRGTDCVRQNTFIYF